MSRRLLLLVFALLISGGTVFLAQRWLHSELASRDASNAANGAVVKPSLKVLVAKADIPAGSFLRPESLSWQDWPQDGLSESYIVEGKAKLEDFVGSVVRSKLIAGEPITQSRVVHPGDRGFMAAVLSPGNRAVTVSVTPSSGMAGFVFPGDHVDLILSMALHSPDKDAETRYVSETVLSDIRVVGMDQRISDDKDKKDISIPKTATLEVTPKQAETIAVVSELGVISLSLRSLATADDAPQASPVSLTWDREATHLPHIAATPVTAHKVDVVRGSEISEINLSPNISITGAAK
jgi:pilus assembly protein CpaB